MNSYLCHILFILMDPREQRASPVSSRSRHWGVVTDAGLVARRPGKRSRDNRASYIIVVNGSYAGGRVAATRYSVSSSHVGDAGGKRRRICGLATIIRIMLTSSSLQQVVIDVFSHKTGMRVVAGRSASASRQQARWRPS